MKYRILAGALVLCLSSFQALAEEQAEDAPQKAPVVSTEDLLNILIQQGLIDEEKLAEVVKKAQDKTRAGFGGSVDIVEESDADTPQEVDSGVVRVPYVPDYIKEEIRDQVRMELREEVVGDVMSRAEKERWGVPGTTPDWTHRIKITGDIRLRAESSLFDDKNDSELSLVSYRDYNKVNSRGSFRLDSKDDVLNITEDRHRLRTRLRLGVKAEVTPGIKAEARLVTGNSSDPVSENQTLGNYGESFEISFDRANLQYKSYENDLKLVGGRFKNPFLHTDLVWDGDYHFDGVATSYWFNRGDSWDDDEIQFDPFITAGLFPIQEVDQDSSDKWLYGVQLGFDYTWWDQDKLSMALTYYHYENITGEYNTQINGTDKDYSAPEYMQKGNTLYNIRNTDSGDGALLALLGEYRLLNLTAKYDIAAFAPHHVILTLDLVQNIALDEAEMRERLLVTGSSSAIGTGDAKSETSANSLQERDVGVQFGVTFGWPIVAKRGDWQTSLIIRHLERDAVVDAFADSDFHLGGTDGKGFILEGKYGLTDETWLQLKWLSSEAVDGNDLGVDIYQVDVNARF